MEDIINEKELMQVDTLCLQETHAHFVPKKLYCQDNIFVYQHFACMEF